MIEKPQFEKEFIILESELEEWEAGGMCWSEEKDLHRSIRDRPSIRQDIIPMTKESLEAFKQQVRQDEREKVLGEIEHKLIESCSENYEPSGMGCKCCQFLIVYDEGLECAIKELRKEDKGK